MTISAVMIRDSISETDHRVCTLMLRYPRFIHAEELTHRILETQPELIISEVVPDGFMYDQNLSRNASSSRAIPVGRMIEDLRRDPAMPVFWGSNKPGMQAGEELDPQTIEHCKSLWLNSMENAIHSAQQMVEAGLHKQIANRILEPWAHINVIVTATEWSNFFALRRHPDAQPEMKVLADAIYEALSESIPTELSVGEWHLPFVDDGSEAGGTDAASLEDKIKVSVARCARVSYLTHDGRQTTFEEDIALYDRLVRSELIHASPAEHQCTPDALKDMKVNDHPTIGWLNPHLHGNLKGWKQYRKSLPNENITEYNG